MQEQALDAEIADLIEKARRAKSQLEAWENADAEAFRAWLFAQRLAPATLGRRISIARQFFHRLLKAKLVSGNPFQDVKTGRGDCQRRQCYIDLATTERLLDAAPNTDWRTIIALAWLGGLRTPSETLSLKWEHIDWQRGLMRVPQPKTEHPGKPFRVCPIFGHLRPWLEAACQAAEPDSVYVVEDETYRRSAQSKNGWVDCNLRTQMLRIIDRAGLGHVPECRTFGGSAASAT